MPIEILENPLSHFSTNKRNLFILDDLQQETCSNPVFTQFLIRGTHHCNVCLINVTHNIFPDAKEARKQATQYHTCILFKNKRSTHQIATLARQTGFSPKTVINAYRDSCLLPFSHLILDMRNGTPNELSILSNVHAEHNKPAYCYK